jgi:acetyltransferase
MTLHKNQVPMSIFPKTPGKVLGAMRRYREWLAKDNLDCLRFTDVEIELVEKALENADNKIFGEAETRPILRAYGLNLVPGDMAKDASSAAELAEKIGFPVVTKVVSPQIFHKSDKGGITLGLKTAEEVRNAVTDTEMKIKRAVPDAVITGYLVEKMAPMGLEVIVGMKHDPAFGPMMMFGSGGVMVELFKDVAFGIAPLTPNQALDMVESTKAGVLLKGYRGSPEYDVEAVVEIIGRLSQVVLDHPSILEIEINPLLVLQKGKGALVLDARMIVSNE